MISIQYFTFGPFNENTYVLHDQTNQCVIIDPGNNTNTENQQLKNFITQNNLTPVRLLLTHAHIDHINGNKFVFDTYGLLPEVNQLDLLFFDKQMESAAMYGLNTEKSPLPIAYINEGDVITFGNSQLQTLHTPGHSPGSITFYNVEQNFMISGDVLFYGSIGRSDLPMGNHQTLIQSIKEKLFTLPNTMLVYSGHGPKTTIGFEKLNNPFLV